MTLILLAVMTVAFVLALGAWLYRLRLTKELQHSATELSLCVSAMMTYMKTTEFRMSAKDFDHQGQLEMHTTPDGIYVKKHAFPEGMDLPEGYRSVATRVE
jgi:hypothetical protein